MKNTKFYGMLMLALLVVQSGVQAKQDDNKHSKKQRTWREAAYENRYNIALGAGTAVALGALGYVYGEDFMAWYKSLSPEDKVAAEEVIDKKIDENLAEIEQKQEKIDEMLESKKLSPAQQKEVRKEEELVAAKQKEVAQAQTWSQWINNVKDSIKNTIYSQSPEAIEERAQYAAKVDAERAARDAEDDGDYRSSDMRTDSEREAYKRDFAMNQADRDYDRDKTRMEKATHKLMNQYSQSAGKKEDYNAIIDNRIKLNNQLNDKYARIQESIDRDYPSAPEGYDLGRVGSDVASGLSSAYNSARDYFTGANNIKTVDVEGAQPVRMSDLDESL